MVTIMHRHLKNARGFTLIEMISVILILGIIAAVAVPSFDKSSIEASTWAATIETDIRYAQELALSRNPALGSPITINFSTGTNSYSLVDPSGVFEDVLRELDGTGTNIDNTISISFNRFGEAVDFGTVQITAGGTTQSITVEQYTGRVTVS